MLRDASEFRSESEQSRVAVIVPVYNRARSVLQTLDSVAAQQRLPDELVIVDDGSTDDLSGSIQRWQSETKPDFPVRLLTQTNQGAASARNLGITATPMAQLYAFLDSDDRWPVDFLARTVGAMISQSHMPAASCDQEWHDAQSDDKYFRCTADLANNPVRWLVQNGGAILSTSVLRAAAVRELGGFDTSFPTGQDSWLLLQLALEGSWIHCPGSPVIYGRNSTHEGEEPHLGERYADNECQWAALHERFIEEEGGRQVLSGRFCNRTLARRWYRAGDQLIEQGLDEQANECFRRSLHYRIRPKSIIAWWKSRSSPKSQVS